MAKVDVSPIIVMRLSTCYEIKPRVMTSHHVSHSSLFQVCVDIDTIHLYSAKLPTSATDLSLDDKPILHDTTFSVCIEQRQVLQRNQVGTFQVGTLQVSTLQVGTFQVSTFQLQVGTRTFRYCEGLLFWDVIEVFSCIL